MNGKQLRAGNCFCLLKVPWSRSQPMYPIHAAQSCLTYGCRSHQREEGGGGSRHRKGTWMGGQASGSGMCSCQLTGRKRRFSQRGTTLAGAPHDLGSIYCPIQNSGGLTR